MVEGRTFRSGQVGLEQRHQAIVLSGQGLADDRFLHHGIAWKHQALIDQILEHLAKDIDGLAADAGSLLRTEEQLVALGRRTQPILAEFENDLALLEDCPFRERAHGTMGGIRKIALDQVADIVGNVSKCKREEQLFGFEIAQLEEKIDLDMEEAEALEDLLFRPCEGKIQLALLSREAGPPIESVNFLLREDLEALGWCGFFLIGHGSPYGHSGSTSQQVRAKPSPVLKCSYRIGMRAKRQHLWADQVDGTSYGRGATTTPALWRQRTYCNHATSASHGAGGSYSRPPDGAADLVLARFGIHLRRGDAAMPQHALDFGEIGAACEHAPRQTMAQRVRGRTLKLAGQVIQLAGAVERDVRHVGPQACRGRERIVLQPALDGALVDSGSRWSARDGRVEVEK